MFFGTKAFAGSFMPIQGSTFAASVDSLYKFLVYASLISCALVIGGMIFFAIKYRRKTNDDKTAYITHNSTLEFIWSFVPFVIFMIVFGWSWYVYLQIRVVPKGAFEINVVGQKWNWDFIYKSGRKSSGEMYAPAGEPIKLILSSRDVIHSFYIPAFRNKQDAVPGMYTQMWFNAPKPGSYQVFCTEYCGEGHSSMLAKIHVLPKDKFEEWLRNDPYKGMNLVQVGLKLFDSRCTACHSVSEENKVGPGFKGLFGKKRDFADGTSLLADENYIRESMMMPAKKVVKGFSNVMTSFQGQLSEQEVLGVIEYIKSLQ